MIQDIALKLEIINKKIKSLESTVEHWENCMIMGQRCDEVYQRDREELRKWQNIKANIERNILREVEHEFGDLQTK